jgi:hypothetical protein
MRKRKKVRGKWKKFHDEILYFFYDRYKNKEVNESMKFGKSSTHGVCKYSFRILQAKCEGKYHMGNLSIG